MRRPSQFLAFSVLVLAAAAAHRCTRDRRIDAPIAARPSVGDEVRARMVLAPRDPSMPGPAPQAAGQLGLDNESCEACHEQQAAQWRGSPHQTAYTDREFQRALAREPMPFCRGCHAPEADPLRPPPPWAAAIGVGCVSCHVVGDTVITTDGPAVAAPHPLRRDPRFSAPDACANCHEFGFPDNHRRPRPEAMQRTIAEHAASPRADTGCADCHMRDRDGARSHAFAGSREPGALREALTIGASRPAADRVEIQVAARPEIVGHAVPTGDLFRRLTIAVRPVGPGPARAWSTGYLTRHYALETGRGAPIRTELADDRPHPGGPAQSLQFHIDPADVGRPVAWEVRFERVESMFAESEAHALVVGALSLASGELPPP